MSVKAGMVLDGFRIAMDDGEIRGATVATHARAEEIRGGEAAP